MKVVVRLCGYAVLQVLTARPQDNVLCIQATGDVLAGGQGRTCP